MYDEQYLTHSYADLHMKHKLEHVLKVGEHESKSGERKRDLKDFDKPAALCPFRRDESLLRFQMREFREQGTVPVGGVIGVGRQIGGRVRTIQSTGKFNDLVQVVVQVECVRNVDQVVVHGGHVALLVKYVVSAVKN